MENTSTTPGLSSVLDADPASWAYGMPLMGYVGNYDRDGNVESLASALLYLAIGEYGEKRGAALCERILESVRHLISGGREPGFNAGPNHSYAPLALALAIIRHTPTVWGALAEDERERLDLIMECFAISTAFVTDDDNFYRTGPALTGNFYKNWNANHRLAMTVPIVGSVLYFNAALRDFDYDSYIEKFDRFGFRRAKYHGTAGGFTHPDGTYIPSARELMMGGGTAYTAFADNHDTDFETRSLRDAPTVGGYGVGIRGNTYTYVGNGLDDIGAILRTLYGATYSGGPVISDTSEVEGGRDESGKPLAYIADGSRSPVEGKPGMMHEFKTGDGGGLRSSASYNTHNFEIVVQTLAVTELLGCPALSPDDPLFALIRVGNTDLIYKNEVGYVNYSLGRTIGLKRDANYPYYLPWKAWWLTHYGMETEQ